MKISKYVYIAHIYAFSIVCISSTNVWAQTPDAALMAHYKLDSTLIDEKGLSNGSLYVAIPSEEEATAPIVYTKGYDSTEYGALLFSVDSTLGEESPWYMVDLGTYSPSDSGTPDEMTCAFWARWGGSTESYQDIINKRDEWKTAGMMWGINQHFSTGNVLSVRRQHLNADAIVGLLPGVWTHVAIALDNVDAKFYLDGELKDTKPYTYGTGKEAMIHVGSSTNGAVDAYNGAIDDIRFYSRVLTDAELAALYSSATTDIKPSDKSPSITVSHDFPSRFNSIATIEYTLAKKTRMEISIYDLFGHKVSQLVNGIQDAGVNKAVWDGSGFSPGIYLLRLNSGDFVDIVKMKLIK